MIKEWDHFSEWLVENYDGPEQKIPEELFQRDYNNIAQQIAEYKNANRRK